MAAIRTFSGQTVVVEPAVEPAWRETVGGDVLRVEPHDWLFEPGDWAAVERRLDQPLPPDYKGLIGDGGAMCFGGELVIASPFDNVPFRNLVQSIYVGAWAMAFLRQASPTHFSVAIFPEPGGIMRWGTDGGGGEYFWDRTSTDPTHWGTFVSGRPVMEEPGLYYKTGMTEYLAALRRGEVPCESLGDWPPPDAEFKRLH